jgi:plastocyanin
LLLVLVIGCSFAACNSSPSSPSDDEPDATVTIGSTGVFPTEVQIAPWGQVQFVNNDTRPHMIVSDPVDLHSECPPVNRVGLLQPGERRNTGTLNLTGTCRFHDHTDHGDARMRGRIVVR